MFTGAAQVGRGLIPLEGFSVVESQADSFDEGRGCHLYLTYTT